MLLHVEVQKLLITVLCHLSYLLMLLISKFLPLGPLLSDVHNGLHVEIISKGNKIIQTSVNEEPVNKPRLLKENKELFLMIFLLN